MGADKPKSLDTDVIANRLEDISGTLKEIVSTLKEINISQKVVTGVLREIKSEFSHLRR